MKSNSKKSIPVFIAVALMLMTATLSSCSADAELVEKPIAETYLDEAKKILDGTIVLNATAMQGTVNKTLLDEGCPLRYYLKWNDDGTLNMQIREFCVGKMPLTIWFTIDVKFMQLNTWEKDEYTGDGWIKFHGTGGKTVYTAIDDDYDDGDGGAGSVTGFLNVKTRQIEFVTNFNVMNMSSDVFLQTVDPSRLSRYEEEFAQYERDLEEYKRQHGIS